MQRVFWQGASQNVKGPERRGKGSKGETQELRVAWATGHVPVKWREARTFGDVGLV